MKHSNERSGYFKSNLSGDMEYKSFVPAVLPPNPPIEIDEEMAELLLQAHKEISYLEGMSALIPNLDLFVSMYVRKEALLSSQIEGTQATLEDIFDPDIEENQSRDVKDVVNYIKATDFALNRLETLPLCARLLREIHEVLMGGVRGQEKNPGEFRISQNWIGGQGSSLRNASYIPPNPQDMVDAISELEKFINDEDDDLDVLIRAALMHYQFETIHPFLDGNGRVGRLMITLFFLENKVLTVPSLYISYFLKANRIEYYDRMTQVRRTGDYEQWIRFFLRALRDAAMDASEAIAKLHALDIQNQELLQKEKRNATMLKIYQYINSNPIIDVSKTAADLELSYNATANNIKRLVDLGILVQSSEGKRNKVFIYEDYLAILRKNTENL